MMKATTARRTGSTANKASATPFAAQPCAASSSASDAFPPEAPADCGRCPRLVGYRAANQTKEPGWFNGAVPSFGEPMGRLLIVGLAPGVTGANRTGRPFTGDFAGGLLYETLARFGFSQGVFDARPDDGVRLIDTMVTNGVRCVPPQNKPIGAEINACRPFLAARIASMPRLEAVVCLGRIAHETTLRALGLKLASHPFAHAARHRVAAAGRDLTLFDSYHCSRYNTNTGRLMPEMFRTVFHAVREELGPPMLG